MDLNQYPEPENAGRARSVSFQRTEQTECTAYQVDAMLFSLDSNIKQVATLAYRAVSDCLRGETWETSLQRTTERLLCGEYGLDHHKSGRARAGSDPTLFCFSETTSLATNTAPSSPSSSPPLKVSLSLGYIPTENASAARVSFAQHLDIILLYLPRGGVDSPPQPQLSRDVELARNTKIIEGTASAWLDEVKLMKGGECPPVFLLYKRYENYDDQENDQEFVEKHLSDMATLMGFDGLCVSDGVNLAAEIVELCDVDSSTVGAREVKSKCAIC